MFSNKSSQSKISHIQRRWFPLRIVYRESILNLDKLVEPGKRTTAHQKKIMTLINEAYKTIRGENPYFIMRFSLKTKLITNLE